VALNLVVDQGSGSGFHLNKAPAVQARIAADGAEPGNNKRRTSTRAPDFSGIRGNGRHPIDVKGENAWPSP
jgi:hypothetical protein